MQFGKLSNKVGRDLYRLYVATGNGILTARREVRSTAGSLAY